MRYRALRDQPSEEEYEGDEEKDGFEEVESEDEDFQEEEEPQNPTSKPPKAQEISESEESSENMQKKGLKNYDSDEDAVLASQLEKLEKQDNSFKSKIMAQNQEDLQKAGAVKAQRKIQEAVFYQRMVVQKHLNAVNQLPQAAPPPDENSQVLSFSAFEESKKSEVEETKLKLRENIASLNEISCLLAKRININLSSVSADSDNLLAKIDQNYEKMLPNCEELIQRWHSRTQVSTSVLNQKLNKKNVQLSALQQPILTQVYKMLENKQFIDTRTHQKREVYRVLGKPVETLEEKLDFQIYDDQDFYHR